MQNQKKIYEKLQKNLKYASKGAGSVVCITGEGGVGKTYLLQKFKKALDADDFLIVEFRGLPTEQPSLSSVYEGLFTIASNLKFSKELSVEMLSKYSKLLPGFGHYITPLIEAFQSNVLQEVIARSGLTIGTSPAPHVVKFICEVAKERNVLIVIDDLQWIDTESWGVVGYLVKHAKLLGWCLVFAYNRNSEHTESKPEDIDTVLDYWKLHSHELGFSVCISERWSRENFSKLCKSVLIGKVKISSNSFDQLYRYTEGIPLHVASVLKALKSEKKIVLEEGFWVDKGDWSELKFPQLFRETTEKRLRRLYNRIPRSREHLEIASVIGKTFTDEVLDSVLDTDKSFACLSEIEHRFRIIEYLLDKRYWTFENGLTQRFIYNSLGRQAERLHLQIAESLQKIDNASFITIAFHYEQAGHKLKAIDFRINEVSRMLSQGMFHAGLASMECIIESLPQLTQLPCIEDMHNIHMMHARCLFHNRHYYEAIEILNKHLNNLTDRETSALYHRWLGRCYLKLSTPNDFDQSIRYLDAAACFYHEKKLLSDEGDTYTDLVVAYAHRNNFKKAEDAFIKAEKAFIKNRDQIGMARLQRRNVIFMESSLSAPILEKLADSFTNWGVPHEAIMSLNNAATEYLYIDQLDKALGLLHRAIEHSVDAGNFGIIYLYANMAIVHLLAGEHRKSRECIHHAQNRKCRIVEQIILDNTRGAITGQLKNPKGAEETFLRVLNVAEETGEIAYIFPTRLNVAASQLFLNKPETALETLTKIKPSADNSYSSFKNDRWLKLTKKCYSILGLDDEWDSIKEKYSWCVSPHESRMRDFPYTLIDMQFWSD